MVAGEGGEVPVIIGRERREGGKRGRGRREEGERKENSRQVTIV